jgi:iron complex outermembrane receptor protein
MELFHKEMDREYLTYSQEFRGVYTGEKFKLLAGIYGDNSKQDFVEIDDTTRLVSEASITESKSLGIFLNVDLPVTEKITFSSGARYDRDKGEFSDDLRAVYLDDTWEELSPRMALSYKPRSNINTYVSVSKGYLAGGFNENGTDDNPISFDQESLWSYETGLKAHLLNDRLFLDFALFYMDIDDYQIRIDLDAEHNYTTNAARVVSMGAELQARAKLTTELSLKCSLGYVDAEFEEYTDSGDDYEGNTVPYSPEYSYTVGTVYRHAKGYYLEADLVGYGRMYLNKENNYPRDPYCIVNAKAGYEMERFDIYLYGENLFDRDYSADGYFGGLYTVYSPPLEAGIKATLRF